MPLDRVSGQRFGPSLTTPMVGGGVCVFTGDPRSAWRLSFILSNRPRRGEEVHRWAGFSSS